MSAVGSASRRRRSMAGTSRWPGFGLPARCRRRWTGRRRPGTHRRRLDRRLLHYRRTPRRPLRDGAEQTERSRSCDRGAAAWAAHAGSAEPARRGRCALATSARPEPRGASPARRRSGLIASARPADPPAAAAAARPGAGRGRPPRPSATCSPRATASPRPSATEIARRGAARAGRSGVAAVFGPDSLAEAPMVAIAGAADGGPRCSTGQIDRLVVASATAC